MKQADEQQTNDRETIAWLFSIFRSTLPLLIIASIGQTVSSGLGVWTAFGSRSVVDAATSGARDEFVRSAVFLFVLILGAITVSIINHAIIERLRARSGVALQARAFGTLIRKDYMATTSRHSGDALNRLTSDVKVVCDGASTIAPTLVALISRLLFAFAALSAGGLCPDCRRRSGRKRWKISLSLKRFSANRKLRNARTNCSTRILKRP